MGGDIRTLVRLTPCLLDSRAHRESYLGRQIQAESQVERRWAPSREPGGPSFGVYRGWNTTRPRSAGRAPGTPVDGIASLHEPARRLRSTLEENFLSDACGTMSSTSGEVPVFVRALVFSRKLHHSSRFRSSRPIFPHPHYIQPEQGFVIRKIDGNGWNPDPDFQMTAGSCGSEAISATSTAFHSTSVRVFNGGEETARGQKSDARTPPSNSLQPIPETKTLRRCVLGDTMLYTAADVYPSHRGLAP